MLGLHNCIQVVHEALHAAAQTQLSYEDDLMRLIDGSSQLLRASKTTDITVLVCDMFNG